MDARQRLLDALAEVERLDDVATRASESCLDHDAPEQEITDFYRAVNKCNAALHVLLPTLSALRDELEAHCRGHHSGLMVDICVKCDDRWPCPTLRTLTRQFEDGF